MKKTSVKGKKHPLRSIVIRVIHNNIHGCSHGLTSNSFNYTATFHKMSLQGTCFQMMSKA